MMSDVIAVDMRSNLGETLDDYERRTYKAYSAMAEFVDNSIASYLKNRDKMREKYGDSFQLQVVVSYNKGEQEIKITDNAYGMTEEEFANALKIGQRPTVVGLNEFGIGLKSAASWFGKKWSVISISPEDKVQRRAIVDIKKLIETKANEVQIIPYPDDVHLGDHGTIVQINDLIRKKITEPNFTNLENRLSSMYRRQLESGEISIRIRGRVLKYNRPLILTEIIDDQEKVWKLDFNEEFESDGKTYHFHGFAALRQKGDYDETGFDLFRNDRVIVEHYSPKYVFGNPNSFVSLRLFGEIDMDDFPVTQSKDGIDWELSDLEDLFIERLKEVCKPLIKYANEYRVGDKKPVLIEAEDESNILNESNIDDAISMVMGANKDVNLTETTVENSANNISQSEEKEDEIEKARILSLPLRNVTYTITINRKTDIQNADADIVEFEENGSNITINVNLNHQLFKTTGCSKEQVRRIENFYVMLIISEIRSRQLSHHEDNLISSYDIRTEMDQIIRTICESEELSNEFLK